ncbi:hypothetical protein Sps_04678 [Shewanella psychrophila]|uniref:Uncharacterized protein n=1 Tax=Shewanella psychrophila TaxID=225848 RepID=A0A1S6HW81_9GAMM|nr:hypothetical protein [Shewanella psychrophila]AQS39761.1 hypothetical protein Sps_04678 [Shewanella psychrophila]
MVNPKVRQGEQNVPVLYKRGDGYYSNTRLLSQPAHSTPKPTNICDLNPRSLARVVWVCSDIHMPIIRQGKITREEDVRRPSSYQEEHSMHT